ncbi:hypothetical protein AAY473_019942 [Plecturocebus cupreus]
MLARLLMRFIVGLSVSPETDPLVSCPWVYIPGCQHLLSSAAEWCCRSYHICRFNLLDFHIAAHSCHLICWMPLSSDKISLEDNLPFHMKPPSFIPFEKPNSLRFLPPPENIVAQITGILFCSTFTLFEFPHNSAVH